MKLVIAELRLRIQNRVNARQTATVGADALDVKVKRGVCEWNVVCPRLSSSEQLSSMSSVSSMSSAGARASKCYPIDAKCPQGRASNLRTAYAPLQRPGFSGNGLYVILLTHVSIRPRSVATFSTGICWLCGSRQKAYPSVLPLYLST